MDNDANEPRADSPGSLPSKLRRIIKIIVAIPLACVLFPVSLAILLGLLPPLLIAVSAVGVTRELLLPRRLARQGRVLRMSELRRRIAESPGTLVLESPHGTFFRRAWWTPDDAAARSPFPPMTEEAYRRLFSVKPGPTLPIDWDHWCWENYLRIPGGTAILVRRGRRSLESRLGKEFPGIPIVQTLSYFAQDPQAPENWPQGRKAWLRDRAALFVCACVILAEAMLGYYFWNWLLASG